MAIFTTAILYTLGYVSLWYAFSLGMTFYNKWIFKTYDFDFPLTVTVIHMFFIFLYAAIARSIRFNFWNCDRPVLSRSDFIQKIIPTGIMGALDIGLSNLSLMMIDITLYTMCKSTVLAFTLLFACLFKLEKLTINLVLVIVTISAGLVLFRAKEGINFESAGFVIVMVASACAGLRWVLTQSIMHRSCPELSHPVDTLFHIAPCMGITLLPFSIFFEGKRLLGSHLLFGGTADAGASTVVLMVIGSCLAFGLVMSEFLLVRSTSSMTLSVGGICKEIITIMVAVFVSGESLTALNIAGLVVSILGIVYYNILKFNGMLQSAPAHYSRVEQADEDDHNHSHDDEHHGHSHHKDARSNSIELKVLR